MNHLEAPPRLRGHHLFCLQFLHGEGRSPEFAMKMMRTLERERSLPVHVVDGPDDLCDSCPERRSAACEDHTGHDTERRILDAIALDLLGIKSGSTVNMHTVRDGVRLAIQSWWDKACQGCESERTCEPAMRLELAISATDADLGWNASC